MSLETGLAGKVVIVTGAGSSIGRATSRRFVQERALVAAWDVNESPADAVQEPGAHAGDAMVDRVDVADAAVVAGGAARAGRVAESPLMSTSRLFLQTPARIGLPHARAPTP